MPGPKRNRRERTDEWASVKQWTLWPEQELYEQIRPLVLFHETAGERAKEIDVPARTLARKSDTEWLLALRRPEPVARKKQNKIVALAEQLTLPSFGATG
jgi:hypothetical protein